MLSSGSQGWAGLKFVPQTRGKWPCDLCSTPTPVGGGGERRVFTEITVPALDLLEAQWATRGQRRQLED